MRGMAATGDMSTLEASLPHEVLVVALVSSDVWTLGAVACSCRGLHDVVEEVLPHSARESLARRCVAAGMQHSAVVDAEGALFSFGTDATRRGFLGHGPADRVLAPTRVPAAGVRFISVATHSFHTLALTAGGAVYSFGHGGCGQLGHGDEASLSAPRRVEALAAVRAVAVAAGQQHSLVLSDCGTPYAFGSGFGGKLGLGDQRPRAVPTRVEALAASPLRAIAAGSHHSLAATREAGDVYAFGSNASFQLGLGTRTDAHAPRRVEALRGVRVAHLAGGEHHSLAVDDAG